MGTQDTSPDSLAGSSEQGSKVQIQRQTEGTDVSDCTELPIPIPSWGFETPPAGSAQTEEHPAESAPRRPPEADRITTLSVVQGGNSGTQFLISPQAQ